MRAGFRQLPLKRPRAVPARPAAWLHALPNVLTVSRLAFAVAFVWLMSYEGPVSTAVATATFGVAALTDLLDGWLARRFKLTTPFGIYMDPFADKVLVLSALAVFLWQNLIPVWMFLIILGRESLVTAMRSSAESRGLSLPAAAAGKQKMLSQTIAIFAVLLAQEAEYVIEARSGIPWDLALARAGAAARHLIPVLTWTPWICLLLATAFSLYSGVDFVLRHRRVFRDG